MESVEKYSIRDLEKLSGIKTHTLRIWERRYTIIEPKRTVTNIRYYTNDDLRRILNISFLNRSGVKISKIAQMTPGEINQAVTSAKMLKSGNEDYTESLMLSMIDMDEMQFERIISSSILRFGFEKTMLHVLFPFLQKTGTMWQTGAINPAQEHFISNIIRQKLIVAIDGLMVALPSDAPVALLFLPEKELHEFSLLFYCYALRSRQVKVVYLGQSVPVDSLPRIIDLTNPDYLITVITNQMIPKGFDKLLESISKAAGDKSILMSGRAIVEYKKNLPANVQVFSGLSELLALLTL